MPLTRLLDCGMDFGDASELFRRTSDGEAWDEVAAELATAWLTRAEGASRSGRDVTARQSYRFAAAAWLFAQMAFNSDTERKRELYERFVAATAAAGACADPPYERVEPAFGDGQLLGWLVRPAGRPAAGAVIILGGLSGWGATYEAMADAVVARGFAALLAEGPGQGIPRLGHGVYLRPNVHEAYSNFVELLTRDQDIRGPVGIWGNSFGGLFAALTAARDQRIAACCVNGAPAVPTIPEFRMAREQIFAALGTADEARAQAIIDELRFDPARERVSGPVLVVHGEPTRSSTSTISARFWRRRHIPGHSCVSGTTANTRSTTTPPSARGSCRTGSPRTCARSRISRRNPRRRA